MAGVDDIIGGWVKSAEKSGEVKKLPGYGKPLALEDERAVPPKYRMAFRILKNSGYTPAGGRAHQKGRESEGGHRRLCRSGRAAAPA